MALLARLQEVDLCDRARRHVFRTLLDLMEVESVPPLDASMNEVISAHVQWATLAPIASFEQFRQYLASIPTS